MIRIYFCSVRYLNENIEIQKTETLIIFVDERKTATGSGNRRAQKEINILDVDFFRFIYLLI